VVKTSLVKAPPVKTPTAKPLMVKAPPVKAPPVKAPTAKPLMVKAPPVKAPTAKAPIAKAPTISAVMPVYNTERYVAQALTAILSQTHPPDEVVVVDDGSTDGTLGELERFRDEVRIVRQGNLGVAGAMNRCFQEASCDYMAKCDADDIWEPDKLERQFETIVAHPEVDIAFAGARFFGGSEGPRAPYAGAGLLDRKELARRLYRANFVCSGTTMVRRSLHERLGPFVEGLDCEDYDYWLRAVSAGAIFFYDPRVLINYRTHENQVSGNLLRMHRAEYVTHCWHAELVEDARLVRKVKARDLSNIARELSDAERPREARATFLAALRQRFSPRLLAWVLVLSMPDRCRRTFAERLVSIRRTLVSPASR
jgi:teichuronic acid biosynthesis glycosyltransferase TuaG